MTPWIAAALIPYAPVAPGPDSMLVAGATCWRYEFRASTFAASAQEEPAIASRPDGSFVAIWSSRRQNDGRYGVYTQAFTPLGVADGAETRLGDVTGAHELNPAVACGGDAVWSVRQVFGADGHAGSIVAARIDSGAAPRDVPVNQRGQGHQVDPVVAVNPAGAAAIAWTSVEEVKATPRVCARVLGADGTPLSDEVNLRGGAGGALTASIAAGPDGGFLVVYAKLDEQRRPAGIAARRLDGDGSLVGDEIDVSGSPRASQIEPVVAATGDGYVVAWLDAESDGDDYGVIARRLDRAGAPVDAPFVANTVRAGPQNAAAIAARADGSFAIAWNSSDGAGTGIFAQWFAADGSRVGGEFRVNRRTEGGQELREAAGTQRLTFGPGGELLCIWSGDGGQGDKSGVYVTTIAPQPFELAGRIQGVTPGMAPADAGDRAADPHRPPTFNPDEIELGEREIRTERGVDFGFDAILSTGWTPPDPHIAVGPSDIVAMTNGRISIFNKNGGLLFTDEIEDSFGFWGSVGATGFVFDPEVIYDEMSGRFFAMAAEAFAPGNRSYVLIAVSDDSTAAGSWFKYRFETTGLAGDLFDSPNIGVNEQAVIVTGDGFGITANYPVYIYDKASLLVGSPPAITRSFTLSTSTQSAGVPPQCFAGNLFYLLEHREGFGNDRVRLIAITNGLTTPTVSEFLVPVSSYDDPEDPPQLGSSVRPETFDQRMWSVAYRDGSFWACQHVNSTRVRARWYQIATNGWPSSGTPALVQSGEIDPGGTVRTFFCSITANSNGTAAMCFSRSSPTERLSMGTTYRLECDTPGTFRTMTVQKSSTTPDNSGRWGDYSGIQPDPATPNRFWAIHEYTTGSWRTWISRIDTEVCFIEGDLDGDGDVDLADLSQLLTSFGLCVGDAGYDPAADLDGSGCVDLPDLSALLTNFGL
ncbi:MAG: hypothetical protein HRF50_09450 [Phycisphaerae bacterium]|jgi:hypothetical protein